MSPRLRLDKIMTFVYNVQTAVKLLRFHAVMREFEERDRLLALQKVMGPSPIIRSSPAVPGLVLKESCPCNKGAVPKRLRERSAKPRFGGSSPPRASILLNEVKSLEPGPQKLFDYQEKKYY